MFKKHNWKIDNDYTTPTHIWDGLIPFLPKDKTIWMPFWCDGKCGKYLSSKGFKIIHQEEDFFLCDRGDLICDNPPFQLHAKDKTKLRIMNRCKLLNKPFCLLFPTTTIQTKYFYEMFDEHTQLIIPRGKYNFLKEGKKTKSCPFYSVWICWKMNLARDINYITWE